MSYYIYIIQSDQDGSYYKGFTENYFVRVQQHNSGQSNYTSRKTPWKLVYIEVYSSKQEALKREKGLKKYSHAQVEELIAKFGDCRDLTTKE